MGFRGKVVEDSLIASGRHCTLCHKFCGTKIELHHIKQKKDGGKDSFDNCLPLCFDCHADVMQYNPDHPKGKKYTITELKRHRNNWYKKVNKSQGNILPNGSYLELDKTTFERLKNLLKSKELILFIKNHGFIMGPFPYEICEYIYYFLQECELPEFEFIDSDLEGLKVKLENNFIELSGLITKHTFDASTENTNRQSIPSEWKHIDPERLEKAIADFENITPEIVKDFDDLIKLGRRKLFAN
ncbi:HNH endonuclease [Tenacibaculum finnmarkense]|uniref:HNH endonuclease n=1 Tax=Tenacibaculum finnmarkense TaxID=2781243 RepID=UPI001EFA85F1|nr:HNH endonuclease [Tenacibaculum finnmarkense]MCG8763482.1 HNH endonuclease [Tenacibaculum finnmarkense]MCG8788869.1 HNH endonuclease [Tenacibaculum finnmarkense]